MRKDERVARIVVLSRRLRWGVWAVAGACLLVVVVVLLVALGLVGDSSELSLGRATLNLDAQMAVGDVAESGRILLLALFAPSLAIVLAVLRLADRLLQLYEQGQIFGAQNARLIHQGGKLIVALAAVNTVAYPIAQLVASRLGMAVDQVTIKPEIGLLLVGVAIIVVGHVMSLGVEMAEDSVLTI